MEQELEIMKIKEWNYEIVCPICKWSERVQQFQTQNKNECINCGYEFLEEYKYEEK